MRLWPLYSHRMSFGKRLLEARKRKGISQEDMAVRLGTKGPAIGRYERDEMKPSVELAAKMAAMLDVSLDYLAGLTDVQPDKELAERIMEVARFPEDDREHVFSVIDAFIAKRKIRSIM